MKKILFVIAMEKEASQIAEELKLTKKSDNIYTNSEESKTILVSGIGKQRTAINLTKYLENNEKPDLIINLGYAGSTNTKIGTWVNVNNSYNYDWKIEGEEIYEIEEYCKKILHNKENVLNLPCYSAESFVTKTDIKEDVIFDMELHSIYIICQMYGIELISLKKVSDNLSLDNYYKNIDMTEVMELKSGLELLDI